MSTFAERVWSVLKTVPAGKVTTYQLLAAAAGNVKAVRAVGTILHHNPTLITVPCHRVVKSTGEIGGYAGGVTEKITLLHQEGIEIINNAIDLNRFLYQPLPYETH